MKPGGAARQTQRTIVRDFAMLKVVSEDLRPPWSGNHAGLGAQG